MFTKMRIQSPKASTVGIATLGILGLSVFHHYWDAPPTYRLYKARTRIEDEYQRAREDIQELNALMRYRFRYRVLNCSFF